MSTQQNLTIEEVLAQSIPLGHRVDKVLVGHNWTMVRSGSLCGIARSPSRDTEGARSVRPDDGFKGMELRDLAAYLVSDNHLARSIGLAAVNCFWNHKDADYPELVEVGGFSGLEPPGDGVLIIGGFRGALRRLTNARIVEREPKFESDIHADDAAPYIAKAKVLAITAQTLMNDTLQGILDNAQNVPRRILIGPSAPLCPLLFNHGITEVSAVVVQDADAAEEYIGETGTMMRDHIAKSVYLLTSQTSSV